MDLLVIVDNYPPLTNSGAIIVGDLVEELYRQKNKITVITFINPEDNLKTPQISDEKNASVIRIPVGDKKRNRLSRALIEISYSRKIIKTLKEIRDIKFDAIIFYSPSIFFGSAVSWLKKGRSVKSYLICRDIFPKWALDVGLLKKNLIYYYFKHIERKLYHSADIIGYESGRDHDYFMKMIAPKDIKLQVLNNWGSGYLQLSSSPHVEILDKNKINIIYGGNIGDAQDLLNLIELVDFGHFSKGVSLTIIGDGSQYDKIEKKILLIGHSNITLHKAMEKNRYLEVLAMADIGLISLNAKLKSHSYPLKMLNYMQLGKPLFAVVNQGNEIIDLINKERIGVSAISADATSINQALRSLVDDVEFMEEAGKNALKLFKRKFSVESATKQILNSLKEL